MTSRPDIDDTKLFDDDLGRLIRQSLKSRVAHIRPPARGRELLLAAAREQRDSLQKNRDLAREEYVWTPPQRPGHADSDYNAWSAFIHARDSVRRMCL